VKTDRKQAGANIKNATERAILRHIKRHRQRKGGSIDYEYIRYLLDVASRDLFTEGWYRHIFERPLAKGKIVAEITPGYSTIPLEGIRYVRQLLPEVRIIYIIRDPVERSLSQLRMLVKRLGTTPSTDQGWRDLVSKSGLWSRSDYAQFVPLWQAVFPEEQLLFIPFGAIILDPAALLRRIEGFVGLKAYSGYRRLKEKIHESKPVAIPDSTIDFISSRMEHQKRFLRSTFGEEFVAMTRASRDGHVLQVPAVDLGATEQRIQHGAAPPFAMP
jgi:hypothetical protein